MEIQKVKSIIEAILFAVGRTVTIEELAVAVELTPEDIANIIESMRIEYEEQGRGIEIVKIDNSYQLTTKKEFYEYIYPMMDKRSKPNLSAAALETLAIIAYNPRISRAEIEAIRGVNSDGTIYRLLEFNLIEEDGKLDVPGKPTAYKTTMEFLRLFGYESLDNLPELPRYKMDENQQLVIEDVELQDESNNGEEESKEE